MEDSQVSLFDIELRSLTGADPTRLAATLADLKVVSSVEAARSTLVNVPTTLGRYVGQETAHAVASALKALGAEVVLQGSQVTCPHCGCSVKCEGKVSESGRGAIFDCPACQGLTFLDTRDSKFHPMLRCDTCRSLLNLPAQAHFGNYRCKCGRILSYSRFEGIPEVVAEKRGPLVTPRVAVLSVVLLLAVAVSTSLLPIPGLDLKAGATQPVARSAPKARRTSAYRQFTASTDRTEVVAALGPPEKESFTQDRAQQVLFYRSYDLYVILDSSRSGYTYLTTVRISDEVILHQRSIS